MRRDSAMAPQNPDYNVMLDDLALAFQYYGGLTYDDNNNLASGEFGQDPRDSTVLTNGLQLNFDYPLTPHVRLSGGFSVEWLWTIMGEDNDGIYLTGTNFAGDNRASLILDLIATEQHLVTISDHLGRFRDISDQSYGFDHDAADLSYWSNESAIQWEYHISPLVEYGLRLQRTTVWVDDSSFDYLERDEDSIHNKLRFQVNPNLTIEPYFTYKSVNYENENWEEDDGSHKPGNNDYEHKELGIAGLYHINPVMDLKYAFGWQWIEVDNSTRPMIGDQTNSYFLETRLDWEITPTYLNYILFYHGTEGSIIPHVNYREITSLEYGFDWQFRPDWKLGAGMAVEYTNESDIGQKGILYEEQVKLTYIISPKATISGWYIRRDHDSDNALREYKQNQLGVQWTYKF